MIYFIQEKGLLRNRVKIGFTDNIKSRLAQLRTHSPSPLKVLLALPGDIQTEVTYHERFAKYRLHGEWFRYGLKLKFFVWLNQFEPFVIDDFAKSESGPEPVTIVTDIPEPQPKPVQPTADEMGAIETFVVLRDNEDFSWNKASQAAFGKGKVGKNYHNKLKRILDKFDIDY